MLVAEMRQLALYLVGASWLGAAGALSACSLLVDTSGLSVRSDAAAGDGPSVDNPTTSDGGDGALPAPDAAPICSGGTTFTTFADFDRVGNVVVTASSVTAVASTSALGAQSGSFVRRDFIPAPPRVHLAYDLTLTRSDVLYVEPGCSVVLLNNADENLRQTFYVDQGVVGQNLDIALSDGGLEHRNTAFWPLPPSGPSTLHVDVDLTTSGVNAKIDVTVDGKTRSDQFAVPEVSIGFFLRCGVLHASRYSSGSATESKSVTIANPRLTLCP